MQDIYEKYNAEGLEILDFPCNQFGGQAPGTNEEIAAFCDAKYGITFQQFSKIDVNGANEHPLYTFLKEQKGFQGFYKVSDRPAGKFSFDLNGDVVTNIKYMGGCDGNLQSLERVLDGWTVEDIESKLGDIKCGRRPTSCSGQLAIAVRQAYDGVLEPEGASGGTGYE